MRVRFAPSPTGPLHIGGVRTALYNYLFAKQQGGDLILRIEDTDTKRFVPGAEDYILEAFRWLGIRFNEGVGIGGSHAPYRQSERKDIYIMYVKQLLDAGLAYYAFDTPGELEAMRKETPNFQYDASTRGQMRNSLTLPADETRRLTDEEGASYVVRLLVEPGSDVVVNDLIRGEVTFNSSTLDDKALFKSADQLPTYHLANVVDDHLMNITHVIRGEEWLPSAPLHVLLYQSLGWAGDMPRFAHLPLLLKPEGSGKLSKRDADRLGFPVFPLEWKDPATGELSVGYRESGYLPEAVVNFLALLGWNPGDGGEILSADDMAERFDLSHCSKSGARFDYEKGKWFNHQYISRKSDKDLAGIFLPMLSARGIEAEAGYVEKVAGLVKERLSLVNEFWDQADFFFRPPQVYEEKAVRKRWKEDSAATLSDLAEETLSTLPDAFDAKETEEAVMRWIEARGYHMGNLMNALRLALVGDSKGPHIFDITETLGKEETLRRIRRAIDQLK